MPPKISKIPVLKPKPVVQIAPTAGELAAIAAEAKPRRTRTRSKKKKAAPVAVPPEWRALRPASVADDPIRRNARDMFRLLMCPDELDLFLANNRDLPIFPSPSTGRRYSHYGSDLLTNVTLSNYNMLFTAPGQNSYAFLIANVSGLPNAGDVLMFNAARADGAWTMSEAGVSALTAAAATANVPLSTVLVAGESVGVLVSSTTAVPQAPAVVSYTSLSGNAARGAWYMITDGSGNYAYLLQPAVVNKRLVVLGDVTIAANAGRPGYLNLYPISSITSGGGTATVTPLTLSTGNAIRAAFQLTGCPIQTPGDPAFFPNHPICASVKVTSAASALVNKYTIENFSVTGGRDGPWNVTTVMSQSTVTSAALAPSQAVLGQRCTNKSTGLLNPDLANAEAFKTAARRLDSSAAEFYTVADLAFAGTQPVQSVSSTTYLPTQMPAGSTAAFQPCNFEDAGWGGGMQMSILFLSGGQPASGNASVPVIIQTYSLEEACVDPNSGLPGRSAMYCAEFIDWSQMHLSNTPTVAKAHSFKDYFSKAWTAAKTFVVDVGGKILSDTARAARRELSSALLAALV